MAVNFSPEVLTKARESGFSDDEIQSVLAQQDQKFSKAFESGFSLDEVATVLSPPKPDQTAGDIAARIPAGIAKASADALVGTSRLMESLNIPSIQSAVGLLPGGKKMIEEGRKYMAGLGESAESAYGVDPQQSGTIPSKIVGGATSLVPAIASGPLAPVTMAGMMGESVRSEAEAAGATETQKNIAFAGGATVGALSEFLLGIPALLRSAKAAGIPEATFKAVAKEAAAQALKSAGREGAQEGLEQIGQNIIASKIAGYDPERKTFANVPEAIALGAVVGGPTGAVVQTAASLDAISAQSRAVTAEVNGTIAEVANSTPPPVVPEAAAPIVVESNQGGVRTEEIITPGQPDATVVVQSGAPAAENFPIGGLNINDIKPAIRVAGELVQGNKGETHQEVLQRYIAENPDKEAEALVDFDSSDNPNFFITPDLQAISREELKAQHGVSDSQGLREKQVTAAQTSATPQTESIPPSPDTEEASTVGGQAPTAQPQATEILSVPQLEERIDILLSKHAAADNETKTKIWNEQLAPLMDQLKAAEQQSMGPGAAAAAETLADYAERRFGQRFSEDPRMAPELKEAAGNRFYEVLPNKVTAAEAVGVIDQMGEDQAERLIRDDKSDSSFAVRSTVGQVLIRRYNEQYQNLREVNPQQAERVLNKAVDLAEWQMDFGTRLGQGVQSFAMWMRLTPEGKLLGIKKAVRKARERHRQQNETEVDEVLDVLGTDRTAEEKTTDMQRLGKKNRVARRVRKKLKELTADKQTPESFYDIASKELGLPDITAEQEQELRDLAAKVDAAADGLPKEKASKAFMAYAANIKGFTATDFALGYFYGNILSGLGTQVVNAVDTFLNILHEANTLAVANPKAAYTIYSGLARGIINSKPDAILALSQGRRVSSSELGQAPAIMENAKFGQKGGVAILDKSISNRIAKAVLESPIAKPLNAWKYIGRAMAASDSVMFRGAQEARSGLLAFRIATEEGLTSSQRTKRVNEILGWDRAEQFMQQARDEGFSGNEQGARATELMLLQRPEGMQQDSSTFAAQSTYNEKPGGTLGFIASLARQLSDKHPGFRLIVPFTNIVANVFNRRLDNLPGVAMYRARRGYYETKEAGDNALVRMNISMGMTLALLGLVAADVIDLTGPGPEDSEKRKQLKETGWRPYSIKAGNGYYSYANTPISLALGIFGNMMDWSRYKKASKEDENFLEATVYAVFGLGSYLFSQSFISGLANFFDMLGASKGKAQFAVRNFISQTASSFVPLTGLLKDLDAMYDDTRREGKTLGAAVLSSIPFARYAGRPALNALGEPIQTGRIRPLGRFVGMEREDKAWSTIASLGLRVPVPDPFFKTDAENYEYQKESGKRTKQWVLENADRLRALPTADGQELMNESTQQIRKGIRGEMVFKSLN